MVGFQTATMPDSEFIQKLWDYGHFWNPLYPETHFVLKADLPKLTLNDRLVQLAVKSYQEADANLVPLSLAAHNRTPVADGEAGPATVALIGLKRCPVPDFTPPDNVAAPAGLESVWATMRARRRNRALGTGSWPAQGCDPTRKVVHSIRDGNDTSRASSIVKNYLIQALDTVKACYAEIGLAVRYILDSNERVEITKKFESLLGSTIGWNELPVTATCNQTLQGRLDSGYSPEWRLWANLEAHETGHGVGLEHTRGHIMNPSILLIWPLSWIGSPSYATLKHYFGGSPIDAPPSPPPPPTPNKRLKITLNGSVPGVFGSRDITLTGFAEEEE